MTSFTLMLIKVHQKGAIYIILQRQTLLISKYILDHRKHPPHPLDGICRKSFVTVAYQFGCFTRCRNHQTSSSNSLGAARVLSTRVVEVALEIAGAHPPADPVLQSKDCLGKECGKASRTAWLVSWTGRARRMKGDWTSSVTNGNSALVPGFTRMWERHPISAAIGASPQHRKCR